MAISHLIEYSVIIFW